MLPAHFAERHGLVVIIALGESVVAIGIGAAGEPLTRGIVAAAVLGIVVISALWWAYFDVPRRPMLGLPVVWTAQGKLVPSLCRRLKPV